MSHGRARTGLKVGVFGLLLGALLMGCQTVTQPSPADLQHPASHKTVLHEGKWIGPAGGSLQMGAYTLDIPANAVSANTYIEMEQETLGEWPVELSPHGIQFAVPVTLSMDAQSEADPSAMQIHWWNPDTMQWEAQASSVAGTVVSASLNHFSRYTLN